jgi:uncharacterized protein YqhQ
MKSSGIGGQAVLEGVMIKNKDHYAVAVRKPDNQIEVKTDEFHSIAERVGLFRLPFFRGMAIFIESLLLGVRTLSDSSNFYEEEKKDTNQKSTSKAGETMTDIGVIALFVLMAIAVFILVPLLFSNLLGHLVHSETLELVLEGILRVIMFIAYVVLISRLEDVKRIFMYHGAEHKCINCVESGQELTVANVRRQGRCHRQCGMGFLLLVMLISFVLFMFIRVDTAWLRYILRIVLIPLIAGISYEFVRLAGNGESKLAAVLNKPCLLLQGLTTREPDDSMIEVAITALGAVFDWEAYQEENGIAKRRSVKKKIEDTGTGETDQNIAAAVPKAAEEEDEFLRALDHYFVYDGAKNMAAGGGNSAKNLERTAQRKEVPHTPGKIPVRIEGNAALFGEKIPDWLQRAPRSNGKMPGKIGGETKISGRNTSRIDANDEKRTGRSALRTENSAERMRTKPGKGDERGE